MKRVLFWLSFCLVLAACAHRPDGGTSPQQLAPAGSVSLGSELSTFGQWFLRLGVLIAGLAIVIRVILFLAWVNPLTALLSKIPGIEGLSFLAIEIGAVLAIVGAMFIWIGDHSWIIWLVVALAVAYFSLRDKLRAWLDVGCRLGKKKVDQVVSNPSGKAP